MIPPTPLMAETDPILIAISLFIERRGRAPDADEVYGLLNFRQAGGVARACAALSKVAENRVAQVRRQQARASA